MSFSQDIAKFSSKSAARAQAVRRAVTVKLFGAVILDTPVLTGRARGNWRFSVGAPALEPVANVDPSGGATVAAMASGVEASTGDVTVCLSNNLPYIERLEYGYSKKAPEGMVRRNAARFKTLVQKEAQQ